MPEAVEVFIPRTCLPRATRNHSPTPKFSGGGQQLSRLVFGTLRRPCPSVYWCSAALIPRPAVKLPGEWRDGGEPVGLCHSIETAVGWCPKRFVVSCALTASFSYKLKPHYSGQNEGLAAGTPECISWCFEVLTEISFFDFLQQFPVQEFRSMGTNIVGGFRRF